FQHFPDNFPVLRECGFLFTSLWLPFHLPLEGGGRPRRGREGVTALRPLPILPICGGKPEASHPSALTYAVVVRQTPPLPLVGRGVGVVGGGKALPQPPDPPPRPSPAETAYTRFRPLNKAIEIGNSRFRLGGGRRSGTAMA